MYRHKGKPLFLSECQDPEWMGTIIYTVCSLILNSNQSLKFNAGATDAVKLDFVAKQQYSYTYVTDTSASIYQNNNIAAFPVGQDIVNVGSGGVGKDLKNVKHAFFTNGVFCTDRATSGPPARRCAHLIVV